MTDKVNPYQPPTELLPDDVKSRLQAADLQARLRETSPVPPADFWLVVGVGIVFLLLANLVMYPAATVLLFAWLGGSLRVCRIYSVRARAALPPLDAHWLLLTSTGVCFTLQAVVVMLGYIVVSQLRLPLGLGMLVAILNGLMLYVVLFLMSIRLAK